MKEKKDKNCLRLKSGKVFYANKGIIGINKKLSIYEGYDGCIDSAPEYGDRFSEIGSVKPDEVKEICEIMIKRWCKLLKKVDDRIEKENIKQK